MLVGALIVMVSANFVVNAITGSSNPNSTLSLAWKKCVTHIELHDKRPKARPSHKRSTSGHEFLLTRLVMAHLFTTHRQRKGMHE